MSLTQTKLTASLGTGYTLGSGTTITSGNQSGFAFEVTDKNCGLLAAAQAMSSLGSSYYAPKVGWVVYDITTPTGESDVIWHNDDGAGNVTNYLVSDCLGTGTYAGGASGGSVKKASISPWLLAGFGLLAWYLLRNKG